MPAVANLQNNVKENRKKCVFQHYHTRINEESIDYRRMDEENGQY